MLGVILPFVTVNPPANALLCDGAQHAKADYPLLYATLDPVFIVDDENFVTPNLVGRFLVGERGAIPIGSTGGQVSVTLTEAQMPVHTHTTVPHRHATIGAASPDLLGALPGASMVPLPATTLPAGVTVNAAGGGESHTNMPPYCSVRYCIVAR
jgi:microcystin-dependent protein